VLTAPITLLTLRTSDALASEQRCGEWVDVPVLLDGCGHAVLTWLDTDTPALSTAPPELAPEGCGAGALAHVHAAQYATFAPAAALWRVAAGGTMRLRAAVTADGVAVGVQEPHCIVSGGAAAASIPDYHFSMLNDAPRNAAYCSGIANAVAAHRARNAGAPPRVLDIGAGAGLLSMLAARAGAADVFACERDEALAATACADIEAAGLGDVVTVVAAHSRDLDRDSVGAFDVIVSEVFGSDPLSEGVLPTLAHAQAELLAPGGCMVPGRVVIHAALAHSGALRSVLAGHPASAAALPQAAPLEARVVRAFDALAPPRCSCHQPDVPLAVLLTDAAQFVVDFNARPPLATQGEMQASARGVRAGDADAILCWFEVVFDGGARVMTGPADGRRQHWPQTLFRLPHTLRVAAGQEVRVAMQFFADRTAFRVLPAA
jgi:type II protein arginine methyltransferase